MDYVVIGRVNKIQSFISRSSRLREVIGASHLLLELDNAVKKKYINDNERSFAGGGNFRIYFDNLHDAIECQNTIFNWFNERIGGRITVEIQHCSQEDETEKCQEVPDIAKLETYQSVLWHLPYQAICQSCGTDVAVSYKGFFGEAARYRCEQCEAKAVAVTDQRQALLDSFVRNLRNAANTYNDDPKLEKERKRKGKAKAAQLVDHLEPLVFQADTYANFTNSRQNVAYLVADGNRIGKLFSGLTPNYRKDLSESIKRIVDESLAEALFRIVDFQETTKTQIPALPLIVGGDDIFVLMPALWALDVAQRFAVEYQKEMSATVHTLGIADKATIGVAVVICKSSYPYKTAHRHASALLEHVKDRAKERNESMVAVDLIIGSDTKGLETLPYLTTEQAQQVLEWRLALKGLPNGKRHELQRKSAAELPDLLSNWERRDKQLVKKLKSALEMLDPDQMHSPKVLHYLLRMWDFTYDLGHSMMEYYSTEEANA